MLDIKLNKTYLTRGGDKVTITNVDYRYSQPFMGNIVTMEGKLVRVASFQISGMYCGKIPTRFDIIKELQ
jgi:hypothetical protein